MRRLLIAAFVFGAAAFAAAQITNVLNPASDLSGKTLVTAEGNRNISGVFTFLTPPLFPSGIVGAPGIASTADTTTGWQLSVGSIGGSLGGVQRFLLNSTGLTVYGVNTVDNTGLVTTAAEGSGSATASSFLRGDRTWAVPSSGLPSCGRLTLTSGTPVTVADVTGASAVTLYFTPLVSCNQEIVWNGTQNISDVLTETSIAIPATTSTMYDVFAFDNAGSINIELLQWTNDTTRATAVTVQNGYLAKAAVPGRRYVGSVRTTGVSGQTEDSGAKRYVWNYYNRAPTGVFRAETTASWAGSGTIYRQGNGSTANQLDVVVGYSEDVLAMQLNVTAGVAGNGPNLTIGIGADSATVPLAASVVSVGTAQTPPTNFNMTTPLVTVTPAIGRHFYAWLEGTSTPGSVTWYGGSTAGGAAGFNSASSINGTWRR